MTTAVEMHRYMLELLRKEETGTVEPTVASSLLSAAQVNYLTTKLDDADANSRMLDTFRVLVPPALVIPNTGGTAPETEIFQLPYDPNPPLGVSRGYWRMLNVSFRLLLPNGNPAPCAYPGGWTVARPIPRDSRMAVERDPHWKPTDWEPYYYFTGNALKAWTGSSTYASEAKIEYIRYPVDIDIDQPVDPELPSSVNREIVHLAVRSYLEVSESRRYPTNLQERTLNP